jgi:hypothetical protein
MQLKFWKTRMGRLAVDAFWFWGVERSIPESKIFWGDYPNYGTLAGPDYPFLV